MLSVELPVENGRWALETMLTIKLFGDFAVLKDGEPVALPPSRKARALLGYLAVEGTAHRRDRLCEIFWQIPDDPRQSLRWALSKLRSVMNEEGIERLKADRERVWLEGDDIDIDLTEIRDAVANGVEKLSDDELAECLSRASGEALEGLELSGQPEYDTWRYAQREQARQLRIALLYAFINRSKASPEKAAKYLAELIAVDPLNIDAHCSLLSVLARAGRKKDAERQHKESMRTLRDVEDADLTRLDAALRESPQVVLRQETPIPQRPIQRELHQQVRFCKTEDDVTVAYASVGDGPPIVKAANWLNHLEFDWESPVWRHIFRDLATSNKLYRYDARGNGLSDWTVKNFSLDTQVRDLEAVVEASGLGQFVLFGMSQGCAVCVEYAVRHPEKVSRLILYGGYARGWNRSGNELFIEQTNAMLTLIRIGWGQDNPAFHQMFTSLFMPDAPAENQEWFNELQRKTTSPENAVALLSALGEVDVRDRLQYVKAPTLIAHARGDMRVPYESGRELAIGIPNADFMTLDTRNHLMPESDPEWARLRDAMKNFLADGAEEKTSA